MMNEKTGYQVEVKKAFEQIEVGVKAVFDSENYKNYLRTMSKFHRYSINNSMLIMMQYPSATMVAGASKWKTEFNRTIKKGAKAIKILIPHPYKREIVVTDDDGNETTVTRDFVYFTLGNTFDVEQTEGPELPTLCKELQEDSDEIRELVEMVSKVSTCPIAYWNLKDGSKGFYSVKDNKIVISKNLKSSAQTLKTLIHEIAHSRLHSTENNIPRQQKEIEAESIAFVVANHFGVDTSEYSFEYIASWGRDKESKELKDILSNIQKQAKTLIEEIEEVITKEGENE